MTFRKFNLQDSFTALGVFDTILCRNVAIYFAEEFKTNLFARLAERLVPGGYVLLGAAESMLGYSDAFELREHKKSVYYRLTDRKERRP